MSGGHITPDVWGIIEKGFHKSQNKISESIFSIGNGHFGQRANFEEYYSGETLRRTYIAGLYDLEKSNAKYTAQAIPAADWIGIDLKIDGEVLDLNHCDIHDFERLLNMKEGYLERSFEARLVSGKIIRVKARRFCSIANREIGAIRYAIKAINFSGTLSVELSIDGRIEKEIEITKRKSWTGISQEVEQREAYLGLETRKTGLQTCTGMRFEIFRNKEVVEAGSQIIKKEKYVACALDFDCDDGDEIVVYKYAANISALNHAKNTLLEACKDQVKAAAAKGFDLLLKEQRKAWAKRWEESDILIEGDIKAQQDIRFHIFQLHQNYSGTGLGQNISTGGFSSADYKGITWESEAYLLPFFLSTSDPGLARNLLVYRYLHTSKAIENAQQLGFKDGAALFPLVTMNGEEREHKTTLTEEAIHRNGAIAFAIYDYIRFTGDKNYLCQFGLEVLIAIARFWSQRFQFSEQKQKYVLLGVTGPNEYESNVANNWYTNAIAKWCLQYAIEALEYVQAAAPDRYKAIEEKIKFYEYTERNQWKKIVANVYLPEDRDLGIFLQQDGYLDKAQSLATELDSKDRPIAAHWSRNRILRSPFIQKADVLQGVYLFKEEYEEATIRRNFDYYEARSVYESPLSRAIPAILAARLNKKEKAYDLFFRMARMDLEDKEGNTDRACHLTVMAATWMALVKGFGGMHIKEDRLAFRPIIPKQWTAYSFKVRFRGHLLKVRVEQAQIQLINQTDRSLKVEINGKVEEILANGTFLC